MTISITLEKGNHNDRGKPLDLRQKNKVKNMTSLHREYLVGKSTSKTQHSNNAGFSSEQRRRKQRCDNVATKRQPKPNVVTTSFASWGEKKISEK